MPTVILLDNSLSMLQTNKRPLSHTLIRRLVRHISQHEPLEHLSLVAFSSKSQILQPFTRQHSTILDHLDSLPIGDQACLEVGLNAVSDLVLAEFACFTNIQVLLITDDVDSLHQESSVKGVCSRLEANRTALRDYYLSTGIDYDQRLHFSSILDADILDSPYFSNLEARTGFQIKYPFSFPSRLDIICLAKSKHLNEQVPFIKVDDLDKVSERIMYVGFDEDNFQVKKLHANSTPCKMHALSKLIDLNNSSGSLYVFATGSADGMDVDFCQEIFVDLFRLYACRLKCGHLGVESIELIPAPLVYKGYQNYEYVERSIGRSFEICGFININELTTAPTVSRHLISQSNCNQSQFLSLLHTTLKSERMSAIVLLDTDWYGSVHSWQDTKSTDKTKSTLMLTIFVPGSDLIQSIISKSAASSSSKPIKSYTKGCIVWYRQENLVSDLQKIVRNAKKMHEKMPIFYKELNKVRKAALSFGFYELFDGVAAMLQREMSNAHNVSNQEMMVQLNHCVYCLRAAEFREYRRDIQPFVANQMYARKASK